MPRLQRLPLGREVGSEAVLKPNSRLGSPNLGIGKYPKTLTSFKSNLGCSGQRRANNRPARCKICHEESQREPGFPKFLKSTDLPPSPESCTFIRLGDPWGWQHGSLAELAFMRKRSPFGVFEVGLSF